MTRPAQHPPTDRAVKQAAFLDSLRARFGIKTDSELATILEMGPPAVSKIRTARGHIGPAFILAVHKQFGLPVDQIEKEIS